MIEKIENRFEFRDMILNFAQDMSPFFDDAVTQGMLSQTEFSEKFEANVSRSLELSEKIASACLRRKPNREERGAFRRVAAQIVCDAEKNDVSLTDDMVLDYAKGFRLISVEDVQTQEIHTDLSATIDVLGRIMSCIIAYDFRHNRPSLLSESSEIIFHTVGRCLGQILPSDASEGERGALVKAIANAFTSLYCSCYERHAYDVTTHLKDKTEDEIIFICAQMSPVISIQNMYNSYASILEEHIIFYAKTLVQSQDKRRNKVEQ